MTRSGGCAIVVTLPFFDATAERAIRRVAASGPAVVLPYGDADAALVQAFCAATGTPTADAPPGATFGAAANAGAAALVGETIAFVDGAEPMNDGWLTALQATLAASDAQIAGPFGLDLVPAPLSLHGFERHAGSEGAAWREVDAVSRDCLVTSRALFDALGGFDETFASDDAALDYCLRAGERGARIVADPAVAFGRQASRGASRAAGERAFAERWRDRADPRENRFPERTGSLVRRTFHSVGILVECVPVPAYRVLVHGPEVPTPDLLARLSGARLKPASIAYAGPDADVALARELTELRNGDGIAFVRCDTLPADDWLNDLVNAIERAPDTVASTVAPETPGGAMAAAADARCTLVAPRLIPQHLRIEPAATFDDAVATWLGRIVDAGRNIARVQRTATILGPARVAIGAAAPPAHAPAAPLASIVMLSWNAAEFTERAVASIRANTAVAHEIIIVDNGSHAETLARVRAIPDIRLIENAVNTGFAFACNQGLAAARGTHLVLLNNDVIVTAGWLEALIAIQQSNPTVGCSAPRTNRIAGAQQIDAVPYGDDLAGLPAFAADRARRLRGRWTREFRVVGFCMCLDRRVVDEIGGLDPRYGTGNFEDDDYSMRIRAAGYDIAVCEDAFIHHFGSVSFRANNVDYNATFARNKARFASVWDVRYDGDSYDARYPFRRGFVRERDYVPLPEPAGVGPGWTRPE